ncbi:22082_t:CDS:2, partial [Gigaspora margarita]
DKQIEILYKKFKEKLKILYYQPPDPQTAKVINRKESFTPIVTKRVSDAYDQNFTGAIVTNKNFPRKKKELAEGRVNEPMELVIEVESNDEDEEF